MSALALKHDGLTLGRSCGANVARLTGVRLTRRPGVSPLTTPTPSVLSQQRLGTTDSHVSDTTRDVVRASLPPSSAYASYTATAPPTAAQLDYANRYFIASKPTFLHGGAKFRSLPASYVPEVCFLGRSNVGKSSLLNALLHRTSATVANVSSRPGRTRELNAFGVHGAGWARGERREDGSRLPDMWAGRGGLVVLDMPGYGKASRDAWGEEILKYLVGRKQLRRTFVLIDGEHGVKRTDAQLLEMLKHHGVAHQIVLSKIDKLLAPKGRATAAVLATTLGRLEGVFAQTKERALGRERRGAGALDDILTCSAQVDVPHGSGAKLGIDNLRWQVLSAAGLGCDAHGKVEKVAYEVDVQGESGMWEPVIT